MDKDILRCFHGARIEKGGTPVYLSDQNFLASLPSNGEKKCLNIVRIEDGSFTELADIFCEIFDGRKIAPGTCVLLGFLSHLGRVGGSIYASIYAQEWRGMVHIAQCTCFSANEGGGLSTHPHHDVRDFWHHDE
jgi:hypothetical protein